METAVKATQYKRRRNFFVDRKFQMQFIIKFCVIVVVTVLFVLTALYFLTKKATTVSFVNSRVVVQGTADFLFPILVQTIIIAAIMVSIATAFIIIFITHRIAGPVYRFKKVIANLGTGNFAGECKIRRKDDLQELASAINEMMANVRVNLKALESATSALKEKIDKGEEPKILKKAVSDLDKTLHNFKF